MSDDLTTTSPSSSSPAPSSRGFSFGEALPALISHTTAAAVCFKVSSQLGATLLELVKASSFGNAFYAVTVALVVVAVPTSARDLLALGRRLLGSKAP